MGLLLESLADDAPAAGEAFIVLDRSLAICAVSSGAERLLATTETEAVNRHVTELLVPAEPEGPGGYLATAVTRAVVGDEQAKRVYVRPANLFGVRMRVRIVHCGPPRAAMLVFEQPGW
jgi:hypothetical protein